MLQRQKCLLGTRTLSNVTEGKCCESIPYARSDGQATWGQPVKGWLLTCQNRGYLEVLRGAGDGARIANDQMGMKDLAARGAVLADLDSL
jgi:hypothetical protein